MALTEREVARASLNYEIPDVSIDGISLQAGDLNSSVNINLIAKAVSMDVNASVVLHRISPKALDFNKAFIDDIRE